MENKLSVQDIAQINLLRKRKTSCELNKNIDVYNVDIRALSAHVRDNFYDFGSLLTMKCVLEIIPENSDKHYFISKAVDTIFSPYNDNYISVNNMNRKNLIIKYPEENGINELFVGYYGTNKIRRFIPNFAYIYSGFFCDRKGIFDEKICEREGNQAHIIYEGNVSVSLTEYIKDCSVPDLSEKFFQILSSLQFASDFITFSHNNLTGNNIYIKKIRNKPLFQYETFFNSVKYYILTDSIAQIYNFGNSSIEHEGIQYNPNQSNNYTVDVIFLLTDLINTLERYENMKTQTIGVYRHIKSKKNFLEELKEIINNETIRWNDVMITILTKFKDFNRISESEFINRETINSTDTINTDILSKSGVIITDNKEDLKKLYRYYKFGHFGVLQNKKMGFDIEENINRLRGEILEYKNYIITNSNNYENKSTENNIRFVEGEILNLIYYEGLVEFISDEFVADIDNIINNVIDIRDILTDMQNTTEFVSYPFGRPVMNI